MSIRMCLATAAWAALGLACENPSKLDGRPAGTPAVVAHSPQPSHAAPPSGQAGAAQPDEDELTGTVIETMDASEYTYAKLDRNGTQSWVAGPKTPIQVGQVIGPVKGTLMQGFHSSTLNRTFDAIYFVGSFPTDAARGAGAPPNPHGAAAAPAVAAEKIAPAPGGLTVAQVFADKQLAGKQVTVRGKVTKVNTGIMNRNWLHVQDGTGSAGTNDLLVTTTATAKVGDVITVRGTVSVDKDLGGGYRYAVLVEDATLTAN